MVPVGGPGQAQNRPKTGPKQAQNRPKQAQVGPKTGPCQAQTGPCQAQSRLEAGLRALGQVGRLGPDTRSGHLVRWSQSQNPGQSHVVTRPCKMHGRDHALIWGPQVLESKIHLWGDIYVLWS